VLDAMVASTFDALEESKLRLDALAKTSSGCWRETRAMLAESAAGDDATLFPAEHVAPTHFRHTLDV
jgi:hypothetical protein